MYSMHTAFPPVLYTFLFLLPSISFCPACLLHSSLLSSPSLSFLPPFHSPTPPLPRPFFSSLHSSLPLLPSFNPVFPISPMLHLLLFASSPPLPSLPSPLSPSHPHPLSSPPSSPPPPQPSPPPPNRWALMYIPGYRSD